MGAARTVRLQVMVTPDQAAQLEQERGELNLSDHVRLRLFGPRALGSELADGARADAWARRRAEWPVACPTCGSRTGDPCRPVEGKRLNGQGWHPARWGAVPEEQREATAEAIEVRRHRPGRGGGR